MTKKMLLVAGLMIVVLVICYFALTRQSHSVDQAGMEKSARREADSVSKVPKFHEAAPNNLPPTLPAERFIGKARDAYRASKEIPQTLAQLPCYCHCDKSIGHKSLHSCFEDDHAASCAVCVDEALLAYRLQKEQGLSAAEVRERIIAQYSRIE